MLHSENQNRFFLADHLTKLSLLTVGFNATPVHVLLFHFTPTFTQFTPRIFPPFLNWEGARMGGGGGANDYGEIKA